METINLWGAAGVLVALTIIYAGMAMWATDRDWGHGGGVMVWIVFACSGGAIIGFWGTWLYQLLVVTPK